MKMKPMGAENGKEKTGSQPPKKKQTGRRIVPLSRGEKAWLISLSTVIGAFLLFNFAAGLSPLLTGRCLRCVVTGNYHCAWLQSSAHLPGRHAHLRN
jgi:hypothetical protein